MKSMRARLKIVLFAPLTVLLLLLGFSPQSVHAQSLAMRNGMGDINVNISCNNPCSNAPVTLRAKQEAPVKDQEDEPEPPEQSPCYSCFQQFTEPQKPDNKYLVGGLVFRPPDLIKLYGKFRF